MRPLKPNKGIYSDPKGLTAEPGDARRYRNKFVCIEVEMRQLNILGKRHKNMIIQVSKYLTHTCGVRIRVTHNVPTEAGKSLRWVQTVTANNEWSRACGATRVDPLKFEWLRFDDRRLMKCGIIELL